MDIITWIGLFIMIFAVAAGWAQIAEIVARWRRLLVRVDPSETQDE